MIDNKLSQLKEEYNKVAKELDRLTQISLKLAGAIEVLTGMKEESDSGKVEADVKKEEKVKAK